MADLLTSIADGLTHPKERTSDRDSGVCLFVGPYPFFSQPLNFERNLVFTDFFSFCAVFCLALHWKWQLVTEANEFEVETQTFTVRILFWKLREGEDGNPAGLDDLLRFL